MRGVTQPVLGLAPKIQQGLPLDIFSHEPSLAFSWCQAAAWCQLLRAIHTDATVPAAAPKLLEAGAACTCRVAMP